ncbi:ankyrin repeat, SAM and basic leucine zipper domain-containing protein 1 isoform X2 [Denticeps clupeoides]|uniref:Ankyrin repeat, SAM and basic leucine zipper domain-containing protein 1 n=1 Tax=Denticeps clupeoides TaxID=299321 RepID=A0AAY4EM48_9TELE|nr:ankyrin repeat, SAM and basic leucine zipper domain-containing protein 1 isoform X2 [Denticeps clupeoides]
MAGGLGECFPAGYESSESGDELDVHGSRPQETPDAETPRTEPGNDRVLLLKRAINAGDVPLVEELLDSGMDVETRLGFQWSPLMYAVHTGHHDLAKVLLDRGASANFSRDLYTVLMAACTASAAEDKIARCVELLLSRKADPSACNRSRVTPLMMAAKEGYAQVVNLLLCHGAEVNVQDKGGFTALLVAVQYGNIEVVLQLLKQGADKTIKTKCGLNAADLAKQFKHDQISRILALPDDGIANPVSSKEDNLFKFFKRDGDPVPAYNESSVKLCDIDLLLHGLNLEHLSDVLRQHDVIWSDLFSMTKDDFEKIGITNPEDQNKLMAAIKNICLDRIDLETLNNLDIIDSRSEELYDFLISLRQQVSCLTMTVQDVISRLPSSASELVLTWDSKKEAQAICTDLVTQTMDLQKEMICLTDLLCKIDAAQYSSHPCRPSSNRRRRALKKLSLGAVLGAGVLLLLLKVPFKNLLLL